MEKLDLRYYLFHAIEPIQQLKMDRNSYEKLHCFLETGYIYPGNQVNKNIPKKISGFFLHIYRTIRIIEFTDSNNLCYVNNSQT